VNAEGKQPSKLGVGVSDAQATGLWDLIWLIACLLLLFVVARFGFPILDSFWLPGKRASLKHEVKVFRTVAALHAWQDANAVNDEIGTASLSKSGDMIILAPGTTVLCIDANRSVVQLRLLDGPNVGQLWELPTCSAEEIWHPKAWILKCRLIGDNT
jgi:hypothetical protein